MVTGLVEVIQSRHVNGDPGGVRGEMNMYGGERTSGSLNLLLPLADLQQALDVVLSRRRRRRKH